MDLITANMVIEILTQALASNNYPVVVGTETIIIEASKLNVLSLYFDCLDWNLVILMPFAEYVKEGFSYLPESVNNVMYLDNKHKYSVLNIYILF